MTFKINASKISPSEWRGLYMRDVQMLIDIIEEIEAALGIKPDFVPPGLPLEIAQIIQKAKRAVAR